MRPVIFIFFTVLTFSCIESTPVKNMSQINHDTINCKLVQATVYQQMAAEKDALAYQAFNLAKRQLAINIKKADKSMPLAIITDLDETMIDNSGVYGDFIYSDQDYPSEDWKNWQISGKAKAVAGAVEFMKYADERGVEIFYISNRPIDLLDATMKNITYKGFPLKDKNHLLLKTDSDSKEGRREMVMENYNVIMLLGDNLGDFTDVFDGVPSEGRKEVLERIKYDLGTKYIILPNVLYGGWLSSLENDYNDLSTKERYNVMLDKLIRSGNR
ncbi:MAG: 5'-nucleotidase, lipoprotein e(P4) family [Hyphomicrobiales bacterium]